MVLKSVQFPFIVLARVPRVTARVFTEIVTALARQVVGHHVLPHTGADRAMAQADVLQPPPMVISGVACEGRRCARGVGIEYCGRRGSSQCGKSSPCSGHLGRCLQEIAAVHGETSRDAESLADMPPDRDPEFRHPFSLPATHRATRGERC